jgi:hypothetical protein
MSSFPPPTTTTATGSGNNKEATQPTGDTDRLLICGICHNVLDQPLVTSCHHRFCTRCFGQLVDQTNYNQLSLSCTAMVACPTCRKPLGKANAKPESDKQFLQLLARTMTQCPQHHIGCQWQGQQQHLIGHRSKCQHNACPNHFKFRHFIGSQSQSQSIEQDQATASSAADRCEFVGTVNDLMMHHDQCVAATTMETESLLDGDELQPALRTTTNNNKYRHAIESILSTSIVQINAGGTVFHTSQHTLQREQGSMLDELMSGAYHHHLFGTDAGKPSDSSTSTTHHKAKQHQATSKPVFLDCDPTAFGHALYWLRTYVCDAERVSVRLASPKTTLQRNITQPICQCVGY